MDVIIQLIIILIVIFSVLKRIKEVGQKGQELDKENIPGKILDIFGMDDAEEKTGQKPSPAGRQEMSDGDYSEPAEITGELSKEPLIPSEVLYESIEAPEIAGDDIFDTQPDSLLARKELINKPVPEIPKPVLSRPSQKVFHEAGKGLDLGFTAPQVINGIIMGEILGPPVSMKHNERV